MTAVSEAALPERDDQFFEELYAEHFDFLVAVAARKFRVPECDAEALAHEVFLSYLRRSHEVLNIHSWMLGAICNASRYYWRQNGRMVEPLDDDQAFERPDPATTRILDSLPDQLAAREALEGLMPRDQEILKMRYFEGCSIIEIGQRLGVKSKYAQKLLTKVLRRAERNYRRKGKR
ncbi:MAG: sigma-70 family RNA polymerase sigma factor [Acidobacteriota bacterium]